MKAPPSPPLPVHSPLTIALLNTLEPEQRVSNDIPEHLRPEALLRAALETRRGVEDAVREHQMGLMVMRQQQQPAPPPVLPSLPFGPAS